VFIELVLVRNVGDDDEEVEDGKVLDVVALDLVELEVREVDEVNEKVEGVGWDTGSPICTVTVVVALSCNEEISVPVLMDISTHTGVEAETVMATGSPDIVEPEASTGNPRTVD